MKLRGFIPSLALALTPAFWTGAMAQSMPLAVVELFTSQACSSCPPTDDMISSLSQRKDMIVLTLPVDYWDYTGWKDTLSLKQHAIRQRGYASSRGKSFLATPQIVVNGVHALKDHNETSVKQVAEKLAHNSGTLTLPVALSRDGDEIEVVLPATPTPYRAEIWLTPVSRSRSIVVDQGENSGRTLHYSHVARGWTKVGDWHGEAATYRIPLSSLRHDGADQIVVLLQAGSKSEPGPILGAASLNIPEQPPNIEEENLAGTRSGAQ